MVTQLEVSPDSALTESARLPTGEREGVGTGPGDAVTIVGDGEGEEEREDAVGGDNMLPADAVAMVGGRGGDMLGGVGIMLEGAGGGILGPAEGGVLGKKTLVREGF